MSTPTFQVGSAKHAACADTSNIQEIRTKLESTFHRQQAVSGHAHILGRIESSGYLQESLTGAYKGMFPRTLGGLGRCLQTTGHLPAILPAVDYCLAAMDHADLERMPHVIGQPNPDGSPSFVDEVDQIDGQAHVILAWALAAAGIPGAAAKGFPAMARLMDRSTTGPYLGSHTRWRCQPGLVLNTHLEHSREGQYWMCYDILTQSFISAALERMIQVAGGLGRDDCVARWSERLAFLGKRIETALIREVDGRRVYIEMLLPTGREPAVADVFGWLQLAPIAAGWEGCDATVLADTVRAWQSRATMPDSRMAMSDWTPDGPGREIYAKVLGWELVFAARHQQWDRIAAILDFVEQVNGAELISEVFTRDDSSVGRWRLRDRGNGEQLVWFIWGLCETRRLLGLEALPR